MKTLFLVSFLITSTLAFGQSPLMETENTVLENAQLRVVEYLSPPQGDVCGKDMHSHAPHLTILLSDATVTVTSQDGQSQEVEAPMGTSLWSESETHSVINTGQEPTRMLLVYLKE